MQISKTFNKNTHWFLEGEVKGGEKALLIPLVDSEEGAGFLAGDSEGFRNKLESYRIPGFSGEDTSLFRVHGTSMYPTIAESDFLIASIVKSLDALEKTDISVVKLADKMQVKRLRLDGGSILPRSDNDDFDDQLVKKEEVKAARKVKGKSPAISLKDQKLTIVKFWK